MRPTFESTVDVLVKAYLNDTLVHGHPCGCAIGNLIAARCNKTIRDVDQSEYYATWNDGDNGFSWFKVIHPDRILHDRANIETGLIQIEATGYSVGEVRRIEREFENVYMKNDGLFNHEEANFKSLLAVVDTLADIHGIDLTIKEEAKKLFVKA